MVVALATLTPAAGFAGPAEDQYEIATRQYGEKRYAEAKVEFEEFLKTYPRHTKAPIVQLFLGETLVQMGNFADARGHFDAFHTRYPEHNLAARALFRRGEAAYLTGDYDKARTHLKAFHEKYAADALNAYALPYLGDLALKADDPAEAQRHYSTALRQHPATTLNDECRFGLAKSLQMQRRFDDAARFYKYLIDKADSPLADDSLLQLGQLQHEQGEQDAALATLGDLTTKYADSDLLAYANYWTGMAQAAKEDWPAAIAAFEKTAVVDATHPLHPASNFQLGEAFRRAGRADEAAAKFQLVLDESPASSWADRAMQGKLRIASDAQQHDGFAEQADAFLKQYPNSPLAYDVRRMLGRSQLKQGEFETAIATLDELAADLRDVAYAAGDENHHPLSRAELRSLLTSTLYLQALAHVGAKQFEKALTAIAPIDAKEDTDAQLAASLAALRASALLGLGRAGEAVEPLQTNLRLQPNGPDADTSRAQLAMAYAQTEKLDDAQRVYDELAKSYKDRTKYLEATHFLAERAFAAGEKAWARELFTTLTDEKNPAEIREQGLAGKAWSELDLKAPVRSAETFDRLLRDFPDSPLVPEAAVARAEALEQIQQDDAALAMYTLVIDTYPDSKQMPAALYRAARLHDRLEQDNEAAALFARLVKDFPQQSNIDAALYGWAWVLRDLDRGQDSSAVFTRVHMEFPRSRYWADATFRLAEQAAAEGNYDRVAELVNAIVDSGSTEDIVAHALHLKGSAAASDGRWGEVSAAMKQLLENFPSSPLALSAKYWIAESLYREGKYDEAAEQFALLARSTQDKTDTWLAMIPLRRAQILGQQKKWAAAYAMAETIAADYPGFSQQFEADYLMGRCLSRQAKFREARQAFARVTESVHGRRTETAAMAQWNIGETYFHQKDFDHAIRAYSRVELLYDFPQWQAASLLQAGKCFESQRKWNEAIERYTKVIDDFADTTFKEEASQRLKIAQQSAGSNSREPTAREESNNVSTMQR